MGKQPYTKGLGMIQVSQLKMGYRKDNRRAYQRTVRPNTATVTDGELPYLKCDKCGLKIIGVPFTQCAKCGSMFCRNCTNGSQVCPKCGYNGKRKVSIKEFCRGLFREVQS